MRGLFWITAASFVLWPAAPSAQTIPVPEPRPRVEAPEIVRPPSAVKPASSWNEKSACAVQLKKLDVDFKVLAQISDAKGCSVAEPVELKSLSPDVILDPPATLDCETALQFTQFTQDVVQAKAKAILGSAIKTINQDSAYVCRTRNGSLKLSEHAFGRAIDIGSFTTQSGKTIPVKALPDDQKVENQFLNEVRKAACGPFNTVLGPGSDPDHALHFHFDMARRKGKAYCVEAAPKRTQALSLAMTNDSLLTDIFNPLLRVEPCVAPSFSACALPQHSPPAPLKQ
ncbi:MAG: extensin family protein [Rhizobiaceae bacterium]